MLPVLAFGQQPILGTQNRTSFASALVAVDVQNGVCAPLTVVYARGTNEPGNIGSVVGPRMFWSFANEMNGNIALQGVNYPADSYGNVVRGATGAPSMTALALQAKAQCPETKLALIGYSQVCCCFNASSEQVLISAREPPSRTTR